MCPERGSATDDATFAIGYCVAGYLLGWRAHELELPWDASREERRWVAGLQHPDRGARARVLAAGASRLVAELEERRL